METEVNYLAVLVAGVVYMIIGALWYSPVMFGNAWMKALGKSKEQVSADFTPLNYVWALLTALIASYGIARIWVWSGGTTLADGLMIGILAGVCFSFTSMWVNDAFEAKKRSLTIINVSYHIVGLTVAGAIIGVW
jgi:hypothetical protein